MHLMLHTHMLTNIVSFNSFQASNMAMIFDSFFKDIFVILISLVICVYAYTKWIFQYWKRKGLPYLEGNFPVEAFINLIWNPKPFGEINKEIYNIAKAKGYKHVGLISFNTPIYMPIDPQYVKYIMSKDSDHFMDRGIYYNEKDDPLSAHLFSIEGVKWRNLRMKLTPTFTSGKMKTMFQTVFECGKQLEDYMENISMKEEPVDIKNILGCFTTDVIASCAFGIECNSFKDTNSEFTKYLKKNFVLTKSQLFTVILSFTAPKFSRWLGIIITPKDVSNFFRRIIAETVEYREKYNFVRKDFLQLLIDLKNNLPDNSSEYQHDGKSLTMDELSAQAFLFLGAGYETSSTTMTFCLYELAINQDIQETVREEINAVLERHDGKLTYECMMEMKYMGQVVEETLRKYPPLPILNRICLADYKIPDTNIIIEKGTAVAIPVLGLQSDGDYFPDPERFDPDRFSEENKRNIPQFSYLPFGEGPRVCIGLRFGMMQVKVGLTVLLKNYVFALNYKTRTPLKMNPASFMLTALGDIWLDVKID
ncbi:hypothetical protein ILUMI_12097 [Ignelater luminosus]|uniref:Cytochrome P450 n=1 Tax=Ignelater luminosus TaxID=2038154 RepID=A0A8K0G9W1_IGNLU|nr:hypothetical protein ILUMI_12097 [Ignelater luminosus]